MNYYFQVRHIKVNTNILLCNFILIKYTELFLEMLMDIFQINKIFFLDLLASAKFSLNVMAISISITNICHNKFFKNKSMFDNNFSAI